MKEVLTVIPLDPEVLNSLIEAQRIFGIYKTYTYQTSFTVTAGITVEVPFYIPVGMVCTRRDYLTFTSDYFSSDILVWVYVGDKLITRPEEGASLARTLRVSFGDDYVKHEEEIVLMKVQNKTTVDAEITVDVRPSLMEKSFYDRFYEPLIKKGYTTLEELTKILSEIREYARV